MIYTSKGAGMREGGYGCTIATGKRGEQVFIQEGVSILIGRTHTLVRSKVARVGDTRAGGGGGAVKLGMDNGEFAKSIVLW